MTDKHFHAVFLANLASPALRLEHLAKGEELECRDRLLSRVEAFTRNGETLRVPTEVLTPLYEAIDEIHDIPAGHFCHMLGLALAFGIHECDASSDEGCNQGFTELASVLTFQRIESLMEAAGQQQPQGDDLSHPGMYL